MLGKGRRKNKIKKVNMGIVKKLLRQKEEQNTLLEGTGLYCDLYPKTSGACNFCDYRKKCFHYEWERDYIHKQRSARESAKLKEKKLAKRIIKDRILKSHLKY